MDRRPRGLLLKAGVWALGLFPLAQVGWWLRDGLMGLGANPIEKVLLHSGWWTLTLLLVTLAVTPVRRITGRNELVRLRRPLGLFAFFWATIHFGVYLGLDQLFAWEFILEDIAERPFITVGFAAWLVLLALAFTSTKGWIRRLGRRWTLLHRGVYLAATLGVIHFYWKVKADTREPLIFAAVFVALLTLRMRWTKRPGRRPRAGGGRGDGARDAPSSAGAREWPRESSGQRSKGPAEEPAVPAEAKGSADARDGTEGGEAGAGAVGAIGTGAERG